MIKGVQTIDKKPLLTIEDIQNYVLGLEIENKKLQQQLDKYKNVIDKIKEYIDEDEWTSVNGVITAKLIKNKIDELLEEVE